MKPLPNIIYDLTSDPNLTTYEVTKALQASINACTSVAVSCMMSHFGQIRRGEITENDIDLMKQHTVDDYNALTEKDTLSDDPDMDTGLEQVVPPYKIAEKLIGIRTALWKELARYSDVDTRQQNISLPRDPRAKPNFDQPMSTEMFYDIRTDNAGTYNEADVQHMVNEDGCTAEDARDTLARQAKRNAASLREQKHEILDEISSFDTEFNETDFSSLPLERQIQVGTKILKNLNRELARISARKRSGDREARQYHPLIRKLRDSTEAMLNELDPVVIPRGLTKRAA